LILVNVRQTQNAKVCTFVVMFFCFSVSQAHVSVIIFFGLYTLFYVSAYTDKENWYIV
jgi:hypothetical protein